MRVGFFVKNSFKRSIGVILLLSPLTLLASNNWSYHQENDRLTNRSFSFARSPMPRTDLYDDLRLAVACKDNKLHVIIEAGVLIASQGSAFDVDIQIDKQAPVKVPMRTFPDSKRKGYTDQQAKQIADALLSGQSVFIRVNTMIRRVLSGEMPLDDAAAPIKQVYADCGLTAGSTGTAEYSLVNFNDAFSKLAPEQQRVVLDKLKGIMGELH